MNYKDFMDHLGNRVDQMDAADEMVVAVCIVILAALIAGALV